MASLDLRQARHEAVIVVPGKNPASRPLGPPDRVETLRDDSRDVLPGHLRVQRSRQTKSRQIDAEALRSAIVMEAKIIQAHV